MSSQASKFEFTRTIANCRVHVLEGNAELRIDLNDERSPEWALDE